jgi:hypothetical protein
MEMQAVTLSCLVTPRRSSAHGGARGTLAGCMRVLPPATRRTTSSPRLGIVRVASGDGGGKISDDVDEVTKKYGLEAGLWKVRTTRRAALRVRHSRRCMWATACRTFTPAHQLSWNRRRGRFSS